MTTKKRAEPGVYAYTTKTEGQLWRIKVPVTLPDGTAREVNKRGFRTKAEAVKARRELLVTSDAGGYSELSKVRFGDYLGQWLAGLGHLRPSTLASYKKNCRVHVIPALGKVPLRDLTTLKLTAFYASLAEGGRADHEAGKGLSPRTVKYIHTIIRKALADAVDDGLLAANPAANAGRKLPAGQAPDMQVWTPAQVRAFLDWSAEHSEQHAAWTVLLWTGMRRGELLGLRWKDVDLARGAITVRRTATPVRNAGEGFEVAAGPTKSGKPRVIDLDGDTVTVLAAHQLERAELDESLVTPGALVFGDAEGRVRNPEHFSRTWTQTVKRALKGGVNVPYLNLHGTRHTHATALLSMGTPVKVVSERLGHASAVITMTVYAHVLPGSQRSAVENLAALVKADAASN